MPKRLCLTLFFVWVIWPTSVFADPALGKKLFKEKNCLLCHEINLPGTEFRPVGPGLKNVRDRHSRDWLRQWLKDPAAVWEINDKDIQDINARYYKYRGSKPQPRESFMATVIGKIVFLSPEEIEHLIDYLLTL